MERAEQSTLNPDAVEFRPSQSLVTTLAETTVATSSTTCEDQKPEE